MDDKPEQPPVETQRRLIVRIAALSATLGVVAAIGLGLRFGTASGLSSLVGTVLGIANVWSIARLVSIMLDEDAKNFRRGRAAILLAGKTIALLTIVGVLIVTGWVRGGALMAGLSVVALSIVLAGVWQGGGDPPSHRSPD